MDVNDARYELPCRVMLAVAAVMHWVYAGMALHDFSGEVEALDVYASLGALLQSASRVFF
jgi:hypothetical protein